MLKFLKENNFQNYLPIACTLIFSLHALIFILTYNVNVPIIDEWGWVEYAQIIKNNDELWQFERFFLHNGHIMIFPNIIFYLSIVFSGWNFTYLMLLGWFMLSISIIPIYFWLQKVNPKLIMLMIPISAVMFNPVQYENFLWGLASVQLFLISSSIIFSIYFLNKIELNRLNIIPAIIFGIVASFSGIWGISVWFLAYYSIILQKKWMKTTLFVWTVSSATMFLIIYSMYLEINLVQEEFNPDGFSLNGLRYFIFYLSHGLALKFEILRGAVGAGILLATLGTISVFIFRRKFNRNFTPWVQLSLAGIFTGMLLLVGRYSDTVSGIFPSRYATFSALDQIAFLVIVTAGTYWAYKKTKVNKKIILIFYFLFILLIIILLSSTYYFGYRDSQIWKEMNDEYLNCLTNPVFEYKCIHPNNIANAHNMMYDKAPILKNLNLHPYHNLDENNIPVPLLEDNNWDIMEKTLSPRGKIENIQIDPLRQISQDDEKFSFKELNDLLLISGWASFTDNSVNVDSIYVFVDDKVHSKGMHGFVRKDLANYGFGDRTLSGWYSTIDPHKISNGCHDISIRITNGNEYGEILMEKQLCKEQNHS